MEKPEFKMIPNACKNADKQSATDFLNDTTAEKVNHFHKSFDFYEKTPLTALNALSKKLGVSSIFVKDESHRFGLNAFKVLGGSYAIGRILAERLEIPFEKMSFELMTSKETRQKLGPLTFVTATDGNHGRGVAFTARLIGQKCVVLMPKGSSLERLKNIQKEGAEAYITDKNYDGTVKMASRLADEKGYIMVQDTAWEGYEDIPLWIMQGYMTIALEAVLQLEEKKEQLPTHLFVQAGVGSYPAAVAGYFASHCGNQKPTIIIVEPNEADCIFRTASENDGKRHFVTGDMKTIMAGLACGEPASLGWEVLKCCADFFISCPDYVAADGMRVLGNPIKGDLSIVSGESGAAGFGAFFELMTDEELSAYKKELGLTKDSRVLLISTEGDTDKKSYQNITWRGSHSRFC